MSARSAQRGLGEEAKLCHPVSARWGVWLAWGCRVGCPELPPATQWNEGEAQVYLEVTYPGCTARFIKPVGNTCAGTI